MDQTLYWCKVAALLFVLAAVVLHGLRVFQGGASTCFGLVSHGWWRGDTWQPYGCVMHSYTRSDAGQCLKDKHVAVIGDSRMRDLFFQLRGRLSGSDFSSVNTKVRSDLKFQDSKSGVTLDFFWRPLLNESTQRLFTGWFQSPDMSPDIILWSLALWVTKLQGFGDKPVEDFKANLTKLRNGPIETLAKGKDILWIQQLPLVEKLLSEHRPYTNIELDKYSKAVTDVLEGSPVEVVSAAHLAALSRPEDTEDGMHYEGRVMQLVVDLVLNKVCNSKLTLRDATCCVPTPQLSPVQILTAVFFLGCWVVTVALWVCRWRQKSSSEIDVEAAHESVESSMDVVFNVVTSIAKFGLILLYIFVADRTPLFMKEGRIYHSYQFVILIVFILWLGVTSWKPVSKSDLLNRDQTEEWRGWMQLVILAYHYTGASQQLTIYVWVRVLVASYIFMSSYGHFSYFWHKGEYSLHRVCQVLFRLNLLTILLCLTMNQPYQGYYFVPLISFCFLVVYATMAAWPRINAALIEDPQHGRNLWMIVVKIFVLFLICWFIWRQQKLFCVLFSWWPIVELFRTEDGKVREWWFRSGLDIFVVVYGLLFGLGVFAAKKREWITPSNPWLLSLPVAAVSLLCSFVGLLGYGILSHSCPNKPECNAFHSWLSFIPITSFILLRNIPPAFRSHYSTIYTWVGKISLELFISQYHIWLANDTKALLVIIPGYPLVNAAVMSFIFVCLAHEISAISGVLTQYAVPKESKALRRRLLIFVAFLVLVLVVQSPTVHQKLLSV